VDPLKLNLDDIERRVIQRCRESLHDYDTDDESIIELAKALREPELGLERFVRLLAVYAAAGAVPEPDSGRLWSLADRVSASARSDLLLMSLQRTIRGEPRKAITNPKAATAFLPMLWRFVELEEEGHALLGMHRATEILDVRPASELTRSLADPLAVASEVMANVEDGAELARHRVTC
jgi:hypothetical protein